MTDNLCGPGFKLGLYMDNRGVATAPPDTLDDTTTTFRAAVCMPDPSATTTKVQQTIEQSFAFFFPGGRNAARTVPLKDGTEATVLMTAQTQEAEQAMVNAIVGAFKKS